MDADHPTPTKRVSRSSRGHPQQVSGLRDAAALAKKHVNFEAPSAAAIRSLKPGDYVKVARNGERFFVEMSGFEGRKYHGIVANDLEKNDDVPADVPIYFYRKNIYCIRKA
jgi:hypothetical protein